ncbi:hypothetical protein ACIRL2_32770 [Embleya sp. NPDC127516]|uniref:hypothetical protein n=1 Tax=Embleya sp. NPDC127516 TaxID=3363990 RepID=UPI00382B90DF
MAVVDEFFGALVESMGAHVQAHFLSGFITLDIRTGARPGARSIFADGARRKWAEEAKEYGRTRDAKGRKVRDVTQAYIEERAGDRAAEEATPSTIVNRLFPPPEPYGQSDSGLLLPPNPDESKIKDRLAGTVQIIHGALGRGDDDVLRRDPATVHLIPETVAVAGGKAVESVFADPQLRTTAAWLLNAVGSDPSAEQKPFFRKVGRNIAGMVATGMCEEIAQRAPGIFLDKLADNLAAESARPQALGKGAGALAQTGSRGISNEKAGPVPASRKTGRSIPGNRLVGMGFKQLPGSQGPKLPTGGAANTNKNPQLTHSQMEKMRPGRNPGE